MNKEPLVYIIILNYNSYEETIRCLKSVKDIEYDNFRVIVVDNNSKDDSVEALGNYVSDYVFLINESNLGYAKGNNVGIEYALNHGAEYLCILNNDVEVERDFLSKLINYLEANMDVGIAGPCICDFQRRDRIQSMGASINLYTGLAQGKMKNVQYDKVAQSFVDVDYLGGACFVIKRKVIEDIGTIPEMYFLFFEETEFCLKAKRKGYKLICLKESKVYHKRSATISKYKGLSYYYLNKNRIVFMRRNASLLQRLVFYIYLLAESIGRILFRREAIALLQIYYEGLKADIHNIDMKKVNKYLEGK